MNSLKDSIERLNVSKISFKRDYVLAQKTEYRLWWDNLKSELSNCGLLDVIDTEAVEKDYSLKERVKRENILRGIIVHRLDEHYHKQVLNIKDPRRILKHLTEQRKIQSNITHTAIRQRMWKLQMHSREKVFDYFEKFDSIVREYETMERAPEIPENELRSIFYNGIIYAIPEIKQADLLYKMQNEIEMPMRKLRMYMLQVEASRKEYQAMNDTGRVAPRAASAWGDIPIIIPRAEVDPELRAAKTYANRNKKYHRCYCFGHIRPNCP